MAKSNSIETLVGRTARENVTEAIFKVGLENYQGDGYDIGDEVEKHLPNSATFAGAQSLKSAIATIGAAVLTYDASADKVKAYNLHDEAEVTNSTDLGFYIVRFVGW